MIDSSIYSQLIDAKRSTNLRNWRECLEIINADIYGGCGKFHPMDIVKTIEKLIQFFSRNENIGLFEQSFRDQQEELLKVIVLFSNRICDPLGIFEKLYDGGVFNAAFLAREYSIVLLKESLKVLHDDNVRYVAALPQFGVSVVDELLTIDDYDVSLMNFVSNNLYLLCENAVRNYSSTESSAYLVEEMDWE